MYFTPWLCPKNPPPSPYPPVLRMRLLMMKGTSMKIATAIAKPENGGQPAAVAIYCMPMLKASEPKRKIKYFLY